MRGIARARYMLEFKQEEAKGAADLMIPAEVMIVESVPCSARESWISPP